MLGGGAAIVMGAFLPWATVTATLVGTLSKAGIDGKHGPFTLLGGRNQVTSGASPTGRDRDYRS
jgi:ABC-type Co2+ transport system permease subunit